jgi:hypothetical protein
MTTNATNELIEAVNKYFYALSDDTEAVNYYTLKFADLLDEKSKEHYIALIKKFDYKTQPWDDHSINKDTIFPQFTDDQYKVYEGDYKKSFYRQASVIDIFAKDLKIIFANEREDNPITSLIVLLTLYDELNKFIAKLGLTYFWDDLYSVFIEDETAITTHILEMFKAQVANTKLATHRKLVETHKP